MDMSPLRTSTQGTRVYSPVARAGPSQSAVIQVSSSQGTQSGQSQPIVPQSQSGGSAIGHPIGGSPDTKVYTRHEARQKLESWVYHRVENYTKAKIRDARDRQAKARKLLNEWSDKVLAQRLGVAQPDKGILKYLVVATPSQKDKAEGKEPRNEKAGATRSRFLLLTYNHSSWIFALPTDSQGEPIKDLKLLEVYCREDFRQTNQIWDKAVADLTAAKKKYAIWHASLGMEICPNTIRIESKLRVHLHVVVEWPSKVRIGKWSNWTIAGCVPSHAKLDEDEFGASPDKRKRKPSSDGMHFYVQMQKKGTVYTKSNYEIFTDFNVNPRWVSVWMQRGKLTYAKAQELYVKCGANVRTNLGNIEAIQAGLSMITQKHRLEMVISELNKRRKRSVSPGEAYAEWESQYDTIQDRYTTLILNGKSRVGKTMFCVYMFDDRSKVLLLNCSGNFLPSLRDFDPNMHLGICFDEITPYTILHNKPVFQCGPHLITTADSPAHAYAVKVVLSGIRLMGCCNDWHEQMEYVTENDKEWLEANTKVIDVEHQLYSDELVNPPLPVSQRTVHEYSQFV